VDLARVLEVSVDELLTGQKPAKLGQKKINKEMLAGLLAALNGML
jgi:hypothetical protein